MKRNGRALLSVFTVIVVLIAVIGSGTAAVCAGGGGTPYVKAWCHNVYVYQGEDAPVFLELSEPCSAVRLEYQISENSWKLYNFCNCPEEDGIRWEIAVEKQYFPDDNEVTFRFVYLWDGGSSSACSESFSVYWDNNRSYYRIMGENRYQTAIKIAEEKMAHSWLGGYPNVIVACGTDFADALGASYLSAWLNAPILLVNKSPAVMNEVAEEIIRYMLPGGGVYILGGTGAVPEYMETALKERGFKADDIQRFAGNNRYDTNLKILSYCGVYSNELLVCCGTDFADALSASALGLPILLVGKTLTPDQKDFLNGIEPPCVDIIGGTGAVSASVAEAIKGFGFKTDRIAGANRYETSLKVAEHFFSDYQRYEIDLAYAGDFPDGLAGGALAYDKNAPLILVDSRHCDHAKTFVKKNGSRSAAVLGGPSLISDAAVEEIIGITE